MEFMELKKLETQEEGWHADWQGTGEGTVLSWAAVEEGTEKGGEDGANLGERKCGRTHT